MIIELYKTQSEIKEIVERLGNEPMRKSSHGFNDYGTMKIIDAAKEQAKRFLENENKEDVAIRVMSVVLGANRNWEKQVQPHLDRMKKRIPQVNL